ncbi:hypothetical protein CCB80_08720 [Armatimonadetes bacterium Uphvl-Ar1]|nr:hypothetical protein CCB80_08720 [Armatimonadetes bacterium Uphvl-Ar1]
METAVAYIRVSSQKQVDDGSSLDTQEKQVKTYAENQGYCLVRIFREEGQSAKTDQRPILQEMLRFCADTTPPPTVVIIPKIDRLARNVSDYTGLRVRLSKLKVRLESIGEKIEDTPVGRFTETILASVAQFDNEIRSERSRGGMVEAVSQGRWVWPAPFGYRNVRVNGKGNIEPHPEQAPFVKEAFEQLAFGHQSAPIIWRRMQAAGMPLSRTRFYSMIENPMYLGKIVSFGGTFDSAPPFVPLVTENIAVLARRALRPSNNPQQYQVEREDFPIRGTALCECGKLLTGYWARSKSGNRYAYYRCMACPRTNYPKHKVEELFDQFLNGYQLIDSEWDAINAELCRTHDRVTEEAQMLSERDLSRKAELDELAGSIAIKNASGVIPDDIARVQLGRITEELAEISTRLAKKSEIWDSSELVAFAREFLETIGARWKAFSLEFKKDLMRFMFPQGVLFDPETGFRTPGKSLLERVRTNIEASTLNVVDRGVEFSNTVTHEFGALQEIVKQYQADLTQTGRSGSSRQSPRPQLPIESTANEHLSSPEHRFASHSPGRRSLVRSGSGRMKASRIGSLAEPTRRSSHGGAGDIEIL